MHIRLLKLYLYKAKAELKILLYSLYDIIIVVIKTLGLKTS